MNPSTHPGVAEPRALKIVGRPPFHPIGEDRAKIARMSRLGIVQKQIAIVFGIDPKTLRKYFRKELNAAIQAHSRVATDRILRAKTRCHYKSASPPPINLEFGESEITAGEPSAH